MKLKKQNKMNKEMTPSLKMNIVLNMLYEILVVITPLITAPYVSRVLRADGVGINSYTTSLLTYFILFASLGTANYGKKVIASHRDDVNSYSKAFWEIELITVFTTILCLVIWITFAFLYKRYTPYMLVLSFTLLSALFDISWLYGGLEKFQYTVSVNSIFKIASVICIFLFVKDQNGVLAYTAIMAISTLLGNASMWLFLPKQVVVTKIEYSSIKKHLRGTLVYFGPTIATSIYTILDKTLIGVITGSDVQNGYYEQATKIINIIKSVCFNSVNGVMVARASFLHSQNNNDELFKIKDISYHIISFLSIGACFGLIGISDIFVPFFFGKGYDYVVQLINLLSVVVVIIGISSVANTIYYVAGGRMKKATRLILIGSFTNLVLNIILISKYQSVGAVVSTLIAESIITLLFVNRTNGFIKWRDIWAVLSKKMISGITMFACIVMIKNVLFGLNAVIMLIVLISVGGIAYLTTLILLRDSSLHFVINLIKRKRLGE